MNTSAGGWSGAIAAYTVALEAANRSPGTVRLHRHYLTQLRKRHPSGPWRVTTHQLRELMASPGWGPEAKKSARSVLRGFYRWGVSEGLADRDPALALVPVIVPQGTPNPAPEDVVETVWVHPTERIRRMGQLASILGLRCCEIARIHAGDLIGTDRDVLHVVGKGSRERDVPVEHDELLEWLRCLEGWAFPNGLGSHLSPGYVSRLMSRELPARWTAHPLRHRWFTVAHDRTRDLPAVSRLGGHRRVETTMRYTRTDDAAARAVIRAAGPTSISSTTRSA